MYFCMYNIHFCQTKSSRDVNVNSETNDVVSGYFGGCMIKEPALAHAYIDYESV